MCGIYGCIDLYKKIDKLAALNIILEDSAGGTTWRKA